LLCSADKERLTVARQELHAMLEEDELKEAMLLVFANKQDQKGSLRAQEVVTIHGVSLKHDSGF